MESGSPGTDRTFWSELSTRPSLTINVSKKVPKRSKFMARRYEQEAQMNKKSA